LLLNHADRTPTKLDHKDHASGASRRETDDIERATKALLEIANLGKVATLEIANLGIVATIGRPDGARHKLYKRISSTLRELQIHIREPFCMQTNSHACIIQCVCVRARVCVCSCVCARVFNQCKFSQSASIS